jgi:hypothetical protein
MLLLLSAWSSVAAAQSLPVSVNVSGNIATVIIGNANNPVADVTLSFDDASGLTAASLGVSAQTVNISDPALLSRLSGGALTAMSSSFPVMITIEPPALGGLSQRRVTHIEVHTHALPYIAGSPLRLFKAQLNGPFRDITDGVLPGSVRTRGSTPGWSQFIIVTDLRGTSGVIAEKFAYLRTQLAALPIGERTPLSNYLDQAEDAVADGRYSDAAAVTPSARRAWPSLGDLHPRPVACDPGHPEHRRRASGRCFHPGFQHRLPSRLRDLTQSTRS